jgi:RNA polymerase sigma factor (sigma-70 family)
MGTHATPTFPSRPLGRGLPLGPAQMGDERLAEMVAHGSERAFVTLYERYHQSLYRYCRSIVHDDADAQDALQSAFAGALVALRRGGRNAPLRPWLFRIAHNEAVSLLRRRGQVAEHAETVQQAAPSAAERALERDRLASLVSDLGELGERQRGALVMRELSGLSHEEIALALGTSVGAAKQAIFEARRALLELAEGRSMRCEDVCRMISDGDGRVLRARRVRAHLRDCDGCADFAAAIPARRAELQALAPPLAPLAAAGLLGHLLGAGSGHGGGAAWVAVGATGKSAGMALAAKALVGVAILSTATVGVTRVLTPASHRRVQATQTSAARDRVPHAGVASGQALRAGRGRANEVASGASARARAKAIAPVPRGVGRGGRSPAARVSHGRRATGVRPTHAGGPSMPKRSVRPHRRVGSAPAHTNARPRPSGSGPEGAVGTAGGGLTAHPLGLSGAGEPASSTPTTRAPKQSPPRPSGPTL